MISIFELITLPSYFLGIKPLSQSLGINYPVLMDTNSEVMTDLHINLLPTLLFVNKNNQIVHIHQGFRPGDEKELKRLIEEYLTENLENE